MMTPPMIPSAVPGADTPTPAPESVGPAKDYPQSLLDSLPDAMIGTDATGHIVLVNRAAETMFRFRRDELIGQRIETLVPQRLHDAHERRRNEYVQCPRSRRMGSGLNAVGRRKDGSEMPVEIALSPMQTHAGVITISILRDITERWQWEERTLKTQKDLDDKMKYNKLAQEQLGARERRYRLLVEATRVIPWEIETRNYSMTYIGPQAERTFGYRLDEWYEKDFWLNHLHPEDREAAIRFYATQSSRQDNHEFEYRFIAADGRVVWVRDLVTIVEPAETGEGTINGVMVDITRQKELEAQLNADKEEQKKLIDRLQDAQNQLVQSEKMASVGQLAAGVAHEINSPVGFVNSNLGTLRGYVTDLLELIGAYEKLEAIVGDGAPLQGIRELKARTDLDYLREDVFDLISESQDGLTRVKTIVQDLNEFSHVGKSEMQWADLHRGIESTLNIVQNEIKYRATVVKEFGELPQVECIASQVNQVFMNLLVNAVHAIDKQGTISVRTGTRGDWVWVAVSDNGCGIPAENISRLFDPFFTTKPIGKGTGLGLSLSYGIVNKHGGRIEVESEVGKGATFRVWLPVTQSLNTVSTA